VLPGPTVHILTLTLPIASSKMWTKLARAPRANRPHSDTDITDCLFQNVDRTGSCLPGPTVHILTVTLRIASFKTSTGLARAPWANRRTSPRPPGPTVHIWPRMYYVSKGDARMPADSCLRPSLQPLTLISTPSHLRKVEQPAVNREAHTESDPGFGGAASNGAEPNASIDGERAAAWGRDGLPKVKFVIAPRTSVIFCAPRANRPHFERGNP
jgi:hypothetical protein